MLISCSSCDRLIHTTDAACPFCGHRLRGTMAPFAVALVGLALGCGPSVSTSGEGAEGDASTSDDASATTGFPTTAGTSPSSTSGIDDGGSGGVATAVPPATTSEGTDTDDTAATTSASGGFIYGAPDTDGDLFECSVWEQDCGEGEKCSPWANDGGNSWNATRCTPLDPDPDPVGDPCTVEGSMFSGVDSCVMGASCLDVDETTELGTCTELCSGSSADPICDETPNAVCLNDDGRIPLCSPTCDPLMQDCPDGDACLPGTFGWGCVFTPDEPDATGEACDFQNACAPGLLCLPDDGTCPPGSTGCCTEVCDLDAADPDAVCTNEIQTCVPYYEDGEAPPGYASVGVCRAPP